jgi:AcrR family transcriptional regulator
MTQNRRTPNQVGRPRTSSRAMLEDAATELFVENGYANTTIDQIAQRAGVSRNTFFNYFDAKSDLLWLEVDHGIDRVAQELDLVQDDAPVVAALRGALLRAAAEFGIDRVPLALTQGEVMGTKEETQSSGLTRLTRRSELVAAFLRSRLGGSVGSPVGELVILSSAGAISAAVSAAWTVWAADGIGRRPLADYVGEAFDTVAGGVDVALGGQQSVRG